MSIATSVAKIGEVLAIWLNPERRSRQRLMGAVTAAENLIALYERIGPYKHYPEEKIGKYIIHYKKQFEAWKDG